MKNSARGELIEPCKLRVSVVKLDSEKLPRFRISIFEFRILFLWHLGAITRLPSYSIQLYLSGRVALCGIAMLLTGVSYE
jgi:hypothetical protein